MLLFSGLPFDDHITGQSPETNERIGMHTLIRIISLAAMIAALCFFAPGKTLGNDSLIINLPGDVPLVMVKILAGTFLMGSSEPSGSTWNTCDWSPACDKPAHQVTIGYEFYLGKYEITQRQWRAVMDTNPAFYSRLSPECPVEQVSWNDCRTFCERASSRSFYRFRLPSEAEWEYACRAGTTTRYFWGNSDCVPDSNKQCELNKYAWWSNNQNGTTHPVGQLLPNPWGLYDILGNVYEWCLDTWHWSYSGAPTDGSPWLALASRDTLSWKVLRGSWRGYGEPRKYTSSFRARHQNYFEMRHDCCGLRIAMDIPTNTRPSPSAIAIPLKPKLKSVFLDGRIIISRGQQYYTHTGRRIELLVSENR
jgi:formylglycine-generating enzyme required for sulfatase activity